MSLIRSMWLKESVYRTWRIICCTQIFQKKKSERAYQQIYRPKLVQVNTDNIYLGVLVILKKNFQTESHLVVPTRWDLHLSNIHSNRDKLIWIYPMLFRRPTFATSYGTCSSLVCRAYSSLTWIWRYGMWISRAHRWSIGTSYRAWPTLSKPVKRDSRQAVYSSRQTPWEDLLWKTYAMSMLNFPNQLWTDLI